MIYACGKCHTNIHKSPRWVRYPKDFTAIPYCDKCFEKAKEEKLKAEGKDHEESKLG